MSNTTVLHPRLQARYDREEVAELDADRTAAQAELVAATAQLASVIPAHDDSVSAAEIELRRVTSLARQMVETADTALRSARGERLRVAYPLEAQINRIQAQLAGNLRHPAIAAGLEQIEQIYEENRHVIGEVPDTPQGLNGWLASSAKDESRRTAQLIAWCQSARDSLTALQFVTCENIDLAVAEILQAQP